jgi:hypothetical protein
MKEESMGLLEAALAGPNCVVSVMGNMLVKVLMRFSIGKKPT